MSMSKFVSPVHLYPLKEYENKSVDIKQDIDLEKGLSGRSFGGRKRNKKTKRVTRKKRKTKRRSRSRKSRRIRKRKQYDYKNICIKRYIYLYVIL